MKYLVPVKFIGINTLFGSNHKGIDFAWNSKHGGPNAPIYASGAGKVIRVVDGKKNNLNRLIKSFGNLVEIMHADGSVTRYAHLRTGAVVKKGDIVDAGEIIGYMGNSGYAFGNHLHFELIKDGKRINPLNYLYVDSSYVYAKSEVHRFKNIREDASTIYVVKKGDNLTKIARRFNTTWKKIYNDNKDIIGDDPNLIKVGQKLVIK